MASNTAKPVALCAVALVVWFGTYWYWEPSTERRLTFALPPAPGAVPAVGIASGGEGMLGTPLAAAATDVVDAGARTAKPAEPVRGGADESAPAKPRVVAPEFTTYTVQKGDVSFESIARRLGGGAKLADAIKRANPFVPPSKLVAGRTQLRIPSDAENVDGKVVVDTPRAAAADVASPPPGSKWPVTELSHTVVAGETLSGIAAKYYSAPIAWKKVFEANKDVMASPEKLKVGMTLRIPPGP